MLGIWIAFTPISLFALISLYHILEFIYDSHHLRIYPGPWLAKFSRLWLASAARSGQRYLAIHQAHLKYGQPLVRVYLFFFFRWPMFRFWISQRLISLGFSSASSHHQGRLVRIAPDEISIADKDAIQVVLGHGTGNTKSEFCEYSIKADDLI